MQAKFTLADRLGAQNVPCQVAGCTRTWIRLGKVPIKGASEDPMAGACEPCRRKWEELAESQQPCARPGCEGTWPWSRTTQLEDFAARRPPRRNLCTDCEAHLLTLSDKEVACAVIGCPHTAVLTPRAQLLAETASPAQNSDGHSDGHGGAMAGPLCPSCEKAASRLKSRAVDCGIHGCTRRWTFSTHEQLQFQAVQRPVDPPPRRMCDACRATFGKLMDREVRCRASGCKLTWTWVREDQLDACEADAQSPKAPQLMCQRCYDLYQTLADVERPCRRAGCPGRWLDVRGAQLARAVRGKAQTTPMRYCASCDHDLGDLVDREIACKTSGCTGTWTWLRQQQLTAGVRPKRETEAAVAPVPTDETPKPETGKAAGASKAAKEKSRTRKRRGEPRAPERRCSACVEFLTDKKTYNIPCSHCATPIFWPPESQLGTHLGLWIMPSMCGACKRDTIEKARQEAREALRAQAGIPKLDPSPS
jgi:hypothetical protein